MNYAIKICLIALLYFAGFYVFCSISYAYVMNSENFRLQSDDVISSGGGATSSAFMANDTVGEVSGPATSTSYALGMGYLHMQRTEISVSSPGTIQMSPSIGGITGGTADATGSFSVITDNAAGFVMSVKTTGAPPPSMTASGDPTYYFNDYSSTPTYGWSVVADDARYGFSVSPQTAGDILPAFADNGSACGSGANTGNCWAGFQGTNEVAIINRQTRTDPASGEAELVKFRAQSGGKFLKNGTYSSSVTITVSAN